MKHFWVVGALLAACGPPAPVPTSPEAAPATGSAAAPLEPPAQWTCGDGREMSVAFYGERVEITFPDGRKLSLPAVVAASGEAYEADAVRFHAKGDEAFIAEGEIVTNCRKKSAE